jgi:hypothetical protein
MNWSAHRALPSTGRGASAVVSGLLALDSVKRLAVA